METGGEGEGGKEHRESLGTVPWNNYALQSIVGVQGLVVTCGNGHNGYGGPRNRTKTQTTPMHEQLTNRYPQKDLAEPHS
jgi:hypothetical protein